MLSRQGQHIGRTKGMHYHVPSRSGWNESFIRYFYRPVVPEGTNDFMTLLKLIKKYLALLNINKVTQINKLRITKYIIS
jgi:hypothetical protein